MASQSLAHRGRVLSTLLMVLGVWGGLVPFIGPYIGFAYTPDKAWAYTSGRLWLSIVPAAAVVLGSLLVLVSDAAAAFGAFLAAIGGVWFVLGPLVSTYKLASHGITTGSPVASHGALFNPAAMRFLEQIGFFYGLGVVILFLAAVSLGEVVVARMAAKRYAEWVDADFDRTQQYGPAY